MDARAAFYAGFTHDELVRTACALEDALAKTRDRVAELEIAGKGLNISLEAHRRRVAELEAIERRATDALRGNASEGGEYERGWLEACAEILGDGDES